MRESPGSSSMRRNTLCRIAGLLLLAFAVVPGGKPLRSQGGYLPPDATRCDPDIPISIELIPLNQPAVGRSTQFRVRVDSSLDPDRVRDIRLIYDIPERVRATTPAGVSSQVLRKSGRTETDLAVVLPDQARYPIRARVVVRLADGKVLSQTAVNWAGVASGDAPAGMIGRIVRPDGSGIRVYRGETVKEPR